jgi:hypothetical protein
MNVNLIYVAAEGRGSADPSDSPIYKSRSGRRPGRGEQHGGGKAPEIYRHDEKKWKAPTLIYRGGSGSAIL